MHTAYIRGHLLGQVFETVAQPIVDAALCGINGTIFAYGQTGSGKTFTMSGGTESFGDRGIIPRALSALFARLRSTDSRTYSVQLFLAISPHQDSCILYATH